MLTNAGGSWGHSTSSARGMRCSYRRLKNLAKPARLTISVRSSYQEVLRCLPIRKFSY